VRRTAVGLARRGLRKGDVLAIYSPNVPEYAVAFHAVSLLGGIVTTVNPTYTENELAQQLRDARARFLVTAPPCFDKAAAVARELGIESPLVFGEAEGAASGAISFDAIAADGEVPAVEIDPRRDLVAMPYSSGTTGLPKGVMLTHHNLVANLLQSAGVLGVRESDVLLGVLPLFHIYGLVVIMNLALYVGAT
jgi:acyl-CoA synthetase (AMP-forming)/AMP-acid ligase II